MVQLRMRRVSGVSNIPCPKCGEQGGLEIKDHRRFFQCYGACGYRDYAKIAMRKNQDKINDEFMVMFERELALIGTNLKIF